MRPNSHEYVTIYQGDTATFTSTPLLSSRGWAFAQRVSDAARNEAYEDATLDDEDLVEPPDASIWRDLPATRWE